MRHRETALAVVLTIAVFGSSGTSATPDRVPCYKGWIHGCCDNALIVGPYDCDKNGSNECAANLNVNDTITDRQYAGTDPGWTDELWDVASSGAECKWEPPYCIGQDCFHQPEQQSYCVDRLTPSEDEDC